MELPKLNKNDYLEKNYDFWKNYRSLLYDSIKENDNEMKLDKTKDNIIFLSEKIGIKATARYFNISPSQVRYYIKKNKR